MKNWIKKLLCKHDWGHYLYNIAAHDYKDNPDLITIGFSNCKKCAHWKIKFIFGNK